MAAGDEIRNLLGLYCERIDAGDFAGVGELFEHGALTEPGGKELARGAEAVAAFYAAGTLLHDGSPRTKHLVTNVVLDIDEAARHARPPARRTSCCSRWAPDRCSRSSPAATTTPSSATTGAGASRSVASSWTSSAT